MFITRSPSQEEPVISRRAQVGVLLVGHGSCQRQEAVECLARHAEALKNPRLYSDVRFAAIHGGPSPEDVLAEMRYLDEVFILPLFMSSGYLVRELLPERLSTVRDAPILRYCRPLGLSPQLAELVETTAQEAADKENWSLPETRLILCAHGSTKDAASRQATERLTDRLAACTSFREVTPSYLEQSPVLASVVDNRPGPKVVVGLFASEGVHAVHDVPIALSNAKTQVSYTGAIGANLRIPSLLATALAQERQSAAAA